MKRYVYYRLPTGKPYRGTDDRYAPTSILKFLGETSRASSDGRAEWQNINITAFLTALRSMFVVLDPDGEELNANDSWQIVLNALRQVLRNSIGKAARATDLLATANQGAAEFFRQPLCDSVVVTTLSIEQLPAKSISVDGHVLTAIRGRGNKYRLPQVLEMHRQGSAFGGHLDSTKYQFVRITTRGRSHHDAVERALGALNLVRGLWSLFDTFGSWSFHGGTPSRKSLGVIHLGPVHTLHKPDGAPATEELYWFDPQYLSDQSLFKDNERWRKIEKNRRSAMRALSGLPHRPDVVSMILRYVDALEQPDPDTALLKMWSLLERITDTVGANYDETIRRTVWIYRDEERGMTKEMLEGIRNYRNLYVHAARDNDDQDQTAYLIKSFVDPHLLRLIFNWFKVKSVEEYAEVLALPSELSVLEQRYRRLGRVLRAKRRRSK